MERTHQGHSLAALAVCVALAVAGCGGTDEQTAAPTPAAQRVDLTIATHGDVDYSELIAQYEALNSGVTITQSRAASSAEGYAAFSEALEGGGLGADVVAVEEAWLGELAAHGDAAANLATYGAEALATNLAPWSLAQSTDVAGRVFAVPVEVRPLALCFNGARLAAAGLPGDREGVALLFAGDWRQAMEYAVMYKEATGLALFDSAASLWPVMSRQLPGGYYDASGAVNIADNEALMARWKLLADAVAAGLTAKATPGDWGGGTALVDGSFAVFVCDVTRLHEVQALAEAAGGDASSGWDVADVMPGGGASAGGTYLAVDANGSAVSDAAAFVLWLAEPAQQAALFASTGAYPASVAAQSEAAMAMPDDAFFGGAPLGALLSSRAAEGTARAMGGDDVYLAETAFGPAVGRLADGSLTADEAWQLVLAAVAEIAPAQTASPAPSP